MCPLPGAQQLRLCSDASNLSALGGRHPATYNALKILWSVDETGSHMRKAASDSYLNGYGSVSDWITCRAASAAQGPLGPKNKVGGRVSDGRDLNRSKSYLGLCKELRSD
jgi:hypothetical protein